MEHSQVLGDVDRVLARRLGRRGIGSDDGVQRIRYVRDSLLAIAQTIEQGVDVRRFLHWSLLDNFEWAFGYRMRFGIVAVDRTSQARSVKPSGRCLADVIRANEVT